ncbi:hypothetical protein Salat_0420000 [Sesamum alatum]|uniref:Uncharacterized protein n=1 Tax=Sesamum alatum TaxID=300844 RepID=A0AAE1Z3L1_9LAMI|nr:hypothetical protein Salat_0420000 [Sesamum alatum]
MGSFSGLGIGLSFVFGCILMGLVGELYYFLWWKKRVAYSSNRGIEDFSFLFCWKRPSSSFNSAGSSQELTNSVRNPQEQEDLEMGSSKDLELKGYGEEQGVETELMRMHNLCGPPRFLFTIKEENKEDLESEDGKSRSSRKGSRTKSLSDLVFPVDGGGGGLTPLSSPTVKAFDSCYSNHGLNPLFESLTEDEINRLRSSPPPKFKFLKAAEDKLIRRLLMEEAERKRGVPVQDSAQNSRMDSSQEEEYISFVKFTNKATIKPVVVDKTSCVH